MAGTTRREQAKLSNRPVDEVDEIDEELDEDDESSSRGITEGKGRATPGRRTREEAQEEKPNFFVRTGRRLVEYVRGVRAELRVVDWPTRAEARRLSTVVIIALIVSSLVLGTISFLFTELFRFGLTSPLILIGFMVIAVGGGFAFYQFQRRRAGNQ